MKTNTYWFCFAITFGIISLLPVFYISYQPRGAKSLNILASAYFLHVFDQRWRDGIFLSHVIAATIFATLAALFIQLRSHEHRNATRTSLRHFFFLTAIIAILLAACSLLSDSVAYRVGAIIPFVGYAISTYSIGWFCRSTED